MEKRSGLSELSVIACMSAVEESPLSVVPLYWVPSVTSRWFLNLQSNSHDTLISNAKSKYSVLFKAMKRGSILLVQQYTFYLLHVPS